MGESTRPPGCGLSSVTRRSLSSQGKWKTSPFSSHGIGARSIPSWGIPEWRMLNSTLAWKPHPPVGVRFGSRQSYCALLETRVSRLSYRPTQGKPTRVRVGRPPVFGFEDRRTGVELRSPKRLPTPRVRPRATRRECLWLVRRRVPGGPPRGWILPTDREPGRRVEGVFRCVGGCFGSG